MPPNRVVVPGNANSRATSREPLLKVGSSGASTAPPQPHAPPLLLARPILHPDRHVLQILPELLRSEIQRLNDFVFELLQRHWVTPLRLTHFIPPAAGKDRHSS